MVLGELLGRLEADASTATAIDAVGDLVLAVQVGETAERFGETPAEYVAAAVRRFAAHADDAQWVGLIGALDRAADPARVALERMVRWALAADRAACAAETGDGDV